VNLVSDKVKKLVVLGDKSVPYLTLLRPIAKRISFVMLPIYFLLLVVYFDFFTAEMSEIILQISALIILVLGLPLSAGLRVDQISLELGTILPREFILVIASLVTWLNLGLIFGFRTWMKNRTGSKD
jgi:hypothetical protein